MNQHDVKAKKKKKIVKNPSLIWQTNNNNKKLPTNSSELIFFFLFCLDFYVKSILLCFDVKHHQVTISRNLQV